MENFLLRAGIALIIAIVVQFISLGVFASSILGNLPILGNLLMIFDIGALIYFYNDGIDNNNFIVFLGRLGSLIGTIYTLEKLSKIDFFVMKLEFERSKFYKWCLIIIGVFINFGYMFVITQIYIPIFELLHRSLEETELMFKQLENLLDEQISELPK
ncbi:hypothetical protein [Paenibacillus sp. M2]|uniref:hypothetical protein n=1 Tax=Paenibacillus sp. M2 TaxID=3341793 RepID=UPI0039899C45